MARVKKLGKLPQGKVTVHELMRADAFSQFMAALEELRGTAEGAVLIVADKNDMLHYHLFNLPLYTAIGLMENAKLVMLDDGG